MKGSSIFASEYPQSRLIKQDEHRLLHLANQSRRETGLKPLALHTGISHLARVKAYDIITENYFNHESPTYGSIYDMLRKADIPFVRAGENLAKGSHCDVIHCRLMNSSGHRRNILRPHFSTAGMAALSKKPSGLVVVQVFVGHHSLAFRPERDEQINAACCAIISSMIGPL